ncbi:MAG: type II secretion system GspH family protein [Proteobacteria bacterium]|nr:type II secretion system GspH family protein [Pseudomonadota bacterium]
MAEFMYISITKGFTLIEVVIVILLIAIAVPAIIFPVFESSKQSYRSEEYLNGLFLAEGKMEEITRFKNISGLDRTINRTLTNKFDDTLVGFNRKVTYFPYSSWRGVFTVTVSKQNVGSIKITTWFTRYSSL